MNILAELKDRFRTALRELVDDPEPFLDLVRISQNPEFGDYQANLAMPLGKQLGQPPPQVAATILERLDVEDLCASVDVAGPGFINLRLRTDWLILQLDRASRDERLGISTVDQPRTIVVDYSSPNVAKPLHVGHIRSTVIGDALCRLLRFQGHRVIADNHLGDWGTQFGMIIYGYRHFVDAAAFQTSPVEELARLYRLVRTLSEARQFETQLPDLQQAVEQRRQGLGAAQAAVESAEKAERKKRKKELRRLEDDIASLTSRISAGERQLAAIREDAQTAVAYEQHPDVSESVLAETAKLHDGDPTSRSLWEQFLPHCRAEIEQIYQRLDVTFDEELGESFYQDRLAAVVDDLTERGLATTSDGAICVFLEGFSAPMLIRKKDGAFLYATTDLATIQYRVETWSPDEILYVVDFRQAEHFAKLFAAARRWGYDGVQLRHVSFGTVLGDDGKPFKTRSGGTVRLDGLLDEAERRAYEVVCQTDDAVPAAEQMDEEGRRRVARAVGIAALKYADLSQNRTSDYVFSYDKMLSLNGNTAAYMQYSYARVHGIFGRGSVDLAALRTAAPQIVLDQPHERGLAFQLLRFSEAIDEALADYRPNLLTNYLYELARCFSAFFESCPVLKAPTPAVRDSRLALCDLTARTLKLGLELLGIQVVERM